MELLPNLVSILGVYLNFLAALKIRNNFKEIANENKLNEANYDPKAAG